MLIAFYDQLGSATKCLSIKQITEKVAQYVEGIPGSIQQDDTRTNKLWHMSLRLKLMQKNTWWNSIKPEQLPEVRVH